jgi:hypothetical protein
MTDAHTSLRDDLEAARTAAGTALTTARNAEQATWDAYQGNAHQNRAAWHEARELKSRVAAGYDLLDRACKAAANMTTGVAK